MRVRYRHTLLCFALLLSGIVLGQRIPEKPDVIPPIVDSTHTLSSSQYDRLYRKLQQYNDTTSTEVFVMLTKTTFGEEIKYYAAQLGDTWEIGQEGKDNGVVLLVAKDDRKVAIQTGYGVEAFLTDAISRRIIEQAILPRFKEGDFYGGIDDGTDYIFKALDGQFQGTGNFKDQDFPIELIMLFITFIVIMIVLSRNRHNGSGGNRGRRSAAGNLLDIIILSNMGRGGYGGSSGGGFGGGGSFGGGGGFGGGGASGGW